MFVGRILLRLFELNGNLTGIFSQFRYCTALFYVNCYILEYIYSSFKSNFITQKRLYL